jgi:hypothetical protein
LASQAQVLDFLEQQSDSPVQSSAPVVQVLASQAQA